MTPTAIWPALTDALGRTTSYAYNPLGNKIAMTQPLPTSGTGDSSSTTTYQYDAFGNLIQTVAPLGKNDQFAI